MLYGIDISEHQGELNFDDIKNKFDFCIMRTSFGTLRPDKKIDFNRNSLRARGILTGFYHYAYPNLNSAESEADFFVKTLGQLREGEPIVLDFEEQFNDPVNWCLTFLKKVEAQIKIKPLLYINLNLAKTQNWQPVIDNGNGLWLAHWDYKPDSQPAQTAWPRVAFRQYSNQGSLQNRRIDLNVFYGDRNAFLAYGRRGEITMPSSIDYFKFTHHLFRDKETTQAEIDNFVGEGLSPEEKARRDYLVPLVAQRDSAIGERDAYKQQVDGFPDKLDEIKKEKDKEIEAIKEASKNAENRFLKQIEILQQELSDEIKAGEIKDNESKELKKQKEKLEEEIKEFGSKEARYQTTIKQLQEQLDKKLEQYPSFELLSLLSDRFIRRIVRIIFKEVTPHV